MVLRNRAGQPLNVAYAILIKIALALIYRKNNLGYDILRWINFIHIAGKPHRNYRKFHFGLLDSKQLHILRNHPNIYRSEIKEFDADGIILENHQRIKTDVVICCTGSSSSAAIIPITYEGNPIQEEALRKVYRSFIITKIPHIIFSHYVAFVLGIPNYLSKAIWIANYIKNPPTQKQLIEQSKVLPEILFKHDLMEGSADYVFERSREVVSEFMKFGDYSQSDYDAFIKNYFFNDRIPLLFPSRKKVT